MLFAMVLSSFGRSPQWGWTLLAVLYFLVKTGDAACGPVHGDFNIHIRLYSPENAAWVEDECMLYTSDIFNASLVKYDPYTKKPEIFEIPGITMNPNYHVAGMNYDKRTDSIYICANAAKSFTVDNEHLAPPNNVLRYNLKTKEYMYNVTLGKVNKQLVKTVGGRTGGLQDLAQDTKGNTYFITTYGSILGKITPDGDTSIFWAPSKENYNNTALGFGGIESFGDYMIVTDTVSHGFLKFDTSKPGSSPVYVKPRNLPKGFKPMADGFVAPPRYHGKIGLWSDDYTNELGGILVFASPDEFSTAKYLGIVANEIKGSAPAITVQMGDSIYLAQNFFEENPNRTKYPFRDITKDVDQVIVNALQSC